MCIGYFTGIILISPVALLNILMRKQEIEMVVVWYDSMGKDNETCNERE